MTTGCSSETTQLLGQNCTEQKEEIIFNPPTLTILYGNKEACPKLFTHLSLYRQHSVKVSKTRSSETVMYEKGMTRKSSIASSVDPISLSLLGDEEATISFPHSTLNRHSLLVESRLSASTPAPVKDFHYWITEAILLVKGCTGLDEEPQKKRKASYESAFGDSFGAAACDACRITDGDLDGEDAHVRIKPEKIETLCKLTKFTRRELQLMYRGFKQDCPSGLVKEETFKSIYAQFFPRTADTSQYAHYVFQTFDPNRSGAITFTDFVIGLSALSRGTVQDKLRWIYSLYDLDGDGYLTKDELYRMISSIYDLLGRSGDIHSDELATRRHAECVFEKLDLNKNGIVTIGEFLDSCLRDENITKSLVVFNTIL